MDENNHTSPAEGGENIESDQPAQVPEEQSPQPTPPEKDPSGEAPLDNPPAEAKPKSRAKKVFGIVSNVVFVLFLAFLAFLVVVTISSSHNVGESSFLGWSLFTVEARSMEPTIKEGSVVFTVEKPAEEINKGDVITFFARRSNVTHRVEGINFTPAQPDVKGSEEDYYSFVTKGDFNDATDPNPVPYADVKGVVVVVIPLLGYLLDFLRPPKLGLLIVVIPCLIIIVVELTKLVRFSKESKTSAKS